ncbi:uncharacterized protein METZ01_LOCUS424499, partial [marine metagenome]
AYITGIEKPYNQVPWFWSDQYDIKLQITGISKNYDQYVVRGDLNEEKFSVIYLKNNRIIALDAINDQKAFTIGKKLIRQKAEIPVEILCDDKIDLRGLIKTK